MEIVSQIHISPFDDEAATWCPLGENVTHVMGLSWPTNEIHFHPGPEPEPTLELELEFKFK
jgi:hypothetical protein